MNNRNNNGNDDEHNNQGGTIRLYCTKNARSRFLLSTNIKDNDDSKYVEGIIVEKSNNIKEWDRGAWDKGKVFSIIIKDIDGEKGYILFYNQEAERFFHQLEEGNVYQFHAL